MSIHGNCDYLCVFVPKFLFGMGVYVFIPMMLFLWLKIVKIIKNRYTWEWVRFFCFGFKEVVQKSSKIHCWQVCDHYYSYFVCYHWIWICSGVLVISWNGVVTLFWLVDCHFEQVFIWCVLYMFDSG